MVPIVHMQLKANHPKDNHASTPEIEQQRAVKRTRRQLRREMRSPENQEQYAPNLTRDQPTKVWTVVGPLTSSEGPDR